MDPLPVQQKVFRRDRSARKRRRSGGEQADSESKNKIASNGRNFIDVLIRLFQATVVK